MHAPTLRPAHHYPPPISPEPALLPPALYPTPTHHPCRSDGELLVTLISRHLVRILKTAPSLQVLDGATLAIQELLRHYSQAEGLQELAAQAQAQGGGSEGRGQQRQRGSREVSPAATAGPSGAGAVEGNLLFAALAGEVQAIVRPYLDSKYQIRGVGHRPLGIVFGSLPDLSFRRWLFLWLSQLVQHHASGEGSARVGGGRGGRGPGLCYWLSQLVQHYASDE